MTALPQRKQRIAAVSVPKPLHAAEGGLFFALLKREGLPLPQSEVVFARDIGRRWRFDFAWQGALFDPPMVIPPNVDVSLPMRRVAVEVEGGAFTRGRHTRGKGFIADMAKYNEAAIRGWIVLRVTPSQLCTLETVELIRRALTEATASTTRN